VSQKKDDTSVTLNVDVRTLGWKEGDQLLLPGSKQWESSGDYTHQADRPIIDTISADGKTVTFTSALQFDHLGAYGVDKDAPEPREEVLQFTAHIGNLTRNVVIESENHSAAMDEQDLSRRGYAMFMEGSRSSRDSSVTSSVGVKGLL